MARLESLESVQCDLNKSKGKGGRRVAVYQLRHATNIFTDAVTCDDKQKAAGSHGTSRVVNELLLVESWVAR